MIEALILFPVAPGFPAIPDIDMRSASMVPASK